MKNLIVILFLLAPAVIFGQGHSVSGNPNQMDVQRNVINDSTALIIPDTASVSPYWGHKPGMIAYHGAFFFYWSAGAWVTPASASSGIPLSQMNDSLALYMRTIAYNDSIIRVYDSVSALRLALNGYQTYDLVTTFAGADDIHYPSALATLNLLNTSLIGYLPVTVAATYYDSIVRVNDSLAVHWAAISNRVLYSDSSSIYYTKYRSDTSRTNIYNALAPLFPTADTVYLVRKIDSSHNGGYVPWFAINPAGHGGQNLQSTGSGFTYATPPTSIGTLTSIDGSVKFTPIGGSAVTVDLSVDSTIFAKRSWVSANFGNGTVTKDSAGYGLLGGNVTTSGYKSVDTSKISTKANVTKVRDSITGIGYLTVETDPIATAKTFTATNGYGIIGLLGTPQTIGSNPTITPSVDSSKLSTKGYRQKGIDSIIGIGYLTVETDPIATAKAIKIVAGTGISVGGASSQTVGTNPTYTITATGAYLPLAGGTMNDGANIAFGTTTGTELGTSTSQKIGFFGATPIVQPISGVDALTGLNNLGILNHPTLSYSDLSGSAPTTTITINGTPMVTTNAYTITATPSGPAGGSLGGTYPNPSIVTNANLTGAVTSVGNATSLGSFASSDLLAALTDETGTGKTVFSISPVFTGTPTATTQTAGDNTTALATDQFVTSAISTATGAYLPLAGGAMTGQITYAGAQTLLSSTTVNLCSATSNVVFISGTTTIANFGTCSTTNVIYVKFIAALTLTNSAALVLLGGANRTTVAGDEAQFENLTGGNWKCISYTPTTETGTGGTVHPNNTALTGTTTVAALTASGTITANGTFSQNAATFTSSCTACSVGNPGATGAVGSTSIKTPTIVGQNTYTVTTTSVNALSISPTYNQASGAAANTDLLINRTETAVGSGAQKFISCQVAGSEKFAINDAGHVTVEGVTSTGATGTGRFLFDNSPTLITPNLGIPSFITLSNGTGLPIGGLNTTGTPSSSTYLRGDYSWQPVTSGVASVTGSAPITTSVSSGTVTVSFMPIPANSIPGNTTGGSAAPTSSYSVSSTAAATVVKQLDGNANDFSNNFVANLVPVTTSTATVVYTAATQFHTPYIGTLSQTVTLPVVSTLTRGHQFQIDNFTTAGNNITVNSSGANLVYTIPPATTCILKDTAVNGTSVTTAAPWVVWCSVAVGSTIPTPSTTNVRDVNGCTNLQTMTVTASTTIPVLKKQYLSNITFLPVSTVTITIGTTLGGNDILTATSFTGGVYKTVNVNNRYSSTGSQTIYITLGSSVSTLIDYQIN